VCIHFQCTETRRSHLKEELIRFEVPGVVINVAVGLNSCTEEAVFYGGVRSPSWIGSVEVRVREGEIKNGNNLLSKSSSQSESF
jgi:hypothetical protein